MNDREFIDAGQDPSLPNGCSTRDLDRDPELDRCECGRPLRFGECPDCQEQEE